MEESKLDPLIETFWAEHFFGITGQLEAQIQASPHQPRLVVYRMAGYVASWLAHTTCGAVALFERAIVRHSPQPAGATSLNPTYTDPRLLEGATCTRLGGSTGHSPACSPRSLGNKLSLPLAHVATQCMQPSPLAAPALAPAGLSNKGTWRVLSSFLNKPLK